MPTTAEPIIIYEPVLYTFLSTISRFSGFFYQCYLIPLALAITVLGFGDKKTASPPRIAVHVVAGCLIAAAVYFILAPYCGDFKNIGAVSQFALLTFIVLYALLFSPMKANVSLVMAAAVIADINWAQSISTQVFMPTFPLLLSNILQFLLLVVALGMVFIFRPSASDHMPRAYWLSMLVIAALSTACLYAVRMLNGRSFYYLRNPTLSIVLISFFIVNLLVYYLYYVLVKEHRRATEMAAMQLRLAQDKEFYERMDALYREFQSLRHELKNHFAVMQSLLQDKDYGKLQAYFENFSGKHLPQLEQFQCQNRIITSVITQQMNAARAEGIHLDAVAAVPEKLGIADGDLCSMLSNMLDNGIEGCRRAGGKLVRATLHTEKNCLFITVTNPAEEDVLQKNPKLSTTKSDPAAHGFGIPLLRRIAEQYDGIVSFSEEDGWFTADAMLYMEGD